MQNRFMGSNLAGLILAMVAVLALAPVMLAQTTQQSGTAPPDLSGVWTQTGRHPSGRFTKEEPPLQPWAMEIYKRNRAGVDPNDTARDDLDPSTFCFPPGPTRAMVGGLFQLIQFPEEVLLLFEGDSTRRIYMDGREHPEGWPFGWMGHSIGKWDGDTLVVDTVGLNDRTATTTDFEGVGNENAVLPPDTVGAIGPNHYVQMVNLSFDIFDRAGNSLIGGPVDNSTLWQGFGGPCEK